MVNDVDILIFKLMTIHINTSKKDIDLDNIMKMIKVQIPTVKETKIHNKNNDPNNNIGKPGYYIAGAAFYDERTGLGYPEDEDWGTDYGGSIEVYKNVAQKVNYMLIVLILF